MPRLRHRVVADARARSSSARTRSTADPPSLPALLDRAWSLLEAAAATPGAALRWLTVATGGVDGPVARTMVVRAADRRATTIAFYTDRRAAKVAALLADPRVAVTGYDPATRVQLRLLGAAAVSSQGSHVDAAWSVVSDSDRDAYRTATAPGSPIDRPAEGWPRRERPGRDDFAVMTVSLAAIEWLELASSGHCRARWTRLPEGWRGAWLVP